MQGSRASIESCHGSSRTYSKYSMPRSGHCSSDSSELMMDFSTAYIHVLKTDLGCNTQYMYTNSGTNNKRRKRKMKGIIIIIIIKKSGSVTMARAQAVDMCMYSEACIRCFHRHSRWLYSQQQSSSTQLDRKTAQTTRNFEKQLSIFSKQFQAMRSNT